MKLVIFVLIKGHYPSSLGKAIGKDIPAFMYTVCSMTCSPSELTSARASFNFNKLPATWIRGIPNHMMAKSSSIGSLSVWSCQSIGLDVHSSHGAVQLEVTPNNSACYARKVGFPQYGIDIPDAGSIQQGRGLKDGR